MAKERKYTPEQIKDNRAKVTYALRFGAYKKCTNTLYDGMDGNMKQMCVWGVITDVYNQNLPEGARKAALENRDTPEARVIKWIGLSQDKAYDMIDRNDHTNTSFKTFARQIAKMKVKGEIKDGV